MYLSGDLLWLTRAEAGLLGVIEYVGSGVDLGRRSCGGSHLCEGGEACGGVGAGGGGAHSPHWTGQARALQPGGCFRDTCIVNMGFLSITC